MADELKEFVRAVLVELHIDRKMRDLMSRRNSQRDLTDVARAKGLTLRWSLERDVELSSDIEAAARAAYVGYLKRYGPEVAPYALVQFLDRRYNPRHVGSKSDAPARGRGEEGRGSERGDDQEAAAVVQPRRPL